MAVRYFYQRCTVFINQIPIQLLKIRNSNALLRGKKSLIAIFSAIVYWLLPLQVPLGPASSEIALSLLRWQLDEAIIKEMHPETPCV